MSCNKHEFEAEEYKKPKKNNMKKVFVLAFTVLLIFNFSGILDGIIKQNFIVMFFCSFGALVCIYMIIDLIKGQ